MKLPGSRVNSRSNELKLQEIIKTPHSFFKTLLGFHILLGKKPSHQRY